MEELSNIDKSEPLKTIAAKFGVETMRKMKNTENFYR